MVYTDLFFGVTNIRGNMQNYSSEFKRLIHKMVSKKPFMKQEINYINRNGERKLFTVYAYKKVFEHNVN